MVRAAHRCLTAPQRGFTLLELMIVVAIVGVLGAFAVPAMKDYLATGRLRSAASDLYSALLQARSEAIKLRSAATVAPISGTSWNSGWTVKVGGNLYQQTDALASSVEVTVVGTAAPIVYGSNGRVSSGAQTVVFYTSGSKVSARCVSVDATGLPRVRTDSNNDPSDGC
jgi:type IV fimbrial biogenesis protein FimT